MTDDPSASDPSADNPKPDDTEDFSEDHPLASPTELAGSTEGAIAAEFAARDVEAQLDADAAGAAAGADLEEDSLPLDGE